MREQLNALAKEIKENYAILETKINQLRSSHSILPVKKSPIDLSVCAVDGGLLAHRLHGADIVITRAVGVNFVYSNSTLKKCSYWPEKNPNPKIFMKNSLDEHEAMVFRSLIRLKEELSCAILSLQKFSPQVLLMDGSLLPLPSDRPGEASELDSLYSEVLKLYEKLYQDCNAKKCSLIGVIKDSRSRKMAKEFGLNCSDSVFCNFLLKEFERTNTMSYSENSGIDVFYIKPSKNDLPLRIETTSQASDFVASIISSLSSFSESFAYPAVLIEADMCAALDPKELEPIEFFLNQLSGMKPLRRNSRPFR
ncbi:NurA domain protein [Candidatus Bilamarchaeum dharawalense]|uniref:NurA domain protein n=1 Tax=Candidatus Bilamarchaeum dharawalense TaxID=2885759 RepID=A0A5E4LWI6_9ARCH|nr:NurA domain protein [Candidatus Bilamarchaeum dharawalense]